MTVSEVEAGVQRPLDACVVRARAWAKISEGGWLKAVGAFGLYWLMGTVVAQVIARVGIATGGMEVTTVADFIRAHADTFGDLGMELPDEVGRMTFQVVKPHFRVIQAVVSAFMEGVLLAGWAAFAVSVMRSGANALQVFSGFHRFVAMGWLMILQSVRIFLWSLLLFVPGLVAFYSYRMSFFIKADHPEWSAWKVLAESKRMMYRNKLRLAWLDATFIGWWLLVLVTFGLAGLFVHPYTMVASAAFYEDLLDQEEERGAAKSLDAGGV